MSGAPKTEEFEEDVDFVDEDEEDEDEDDFVPGVEEHDEEDVEEDIVPLLDGYLYADDSQSLHYQGDGFHLSSSEAPEWNLIGAGVDKDRKEGDSLELVMTGPCDFESAEAKATPRKMKVKFSLVSSSDVDPILGELAHSSGGKGKQLLPSSNGKSSNLKAASEDEEDEMKVKASPKPAPKQGGDEKSPSKSTTLVYKVFGHQIETHGGDVLEFMGVFYPPQAKEEQVSLTCQVRMLSAPVAPAVVASPVAAAASSNSARIDREDDDDDDDDEEYEEGVDDDELIALHDDARLSVDALQKRYRGSKDGSGEVEESGKAKRSRKPPPANDDDDYGF